MLETNWQRRLLGSMGLPPTRENITFLTNWQRMEGGGTANTANFNPLNTTSGRGSSINSVGVKSFGSAGQGLAATRATLLNGRYQNIVQGLRSGNPYANPGVAGDLETWVSGSRSGNPTYASRVLGSHVAAGAPAGPAAPSGGLDLTSFRKALAKNLIQTSQRLAAGNMMPDTKGLIQLAQARNNAIAAYQQFGPVVSAKGTLHPPVATGNGAIDRVLSAAHSQAGLPYQFGSESPGSSFDCSGLVQWAYGQIGVKLPRTTYQQVHAGRPVTNWNDLQPGDLIFSAGSDGSNSNPGHVVMYVGGGRVIAAPHTGTVVQYQPVSDFKTSAVAIRRVV